MYLSCLLALLLAAPGDRAHRPGRGPGQAAQPAAIVNPVTGDPVERLAARLVARQPISLVCLGDSITAGWQVPEPAVNGYPTLLGRMLEDRWPGTVVTVSNKGIPGNTTSDGLARFDNDVTPLAPHLVVLQFGGNDKGLGTGLENLPGYQKNLRELAAKCAAIGAACLICTPPMHEVTTDMPFPRAAYRVAQELHLPPADLDTALKRREHDYRGFFPYGNHPQEPGQAVMANEIYRALCELLGQPLQTSVTIDDEVQPAIGLGNFLQVPIRIKNLSDKPRKVTLKGEAILTFALEPVDVPAKSESLQFLPVALPHTLSGGRSLEWPLWVSGASEGEVSFGLARITAVPVMECPLASHANSRAPFATLASAHLAAQREPWTGDRDLSADLRLAYDADTVTITVDVTDDILVTSGYMPDVDSVEVFLDLRDDANRGKPFYGTQCITLLIAATEPGVAPKAVTLNLDRMPPAFKALKPTCTRTTRGYSIVLPLPRAALDEVAGAPVKAFGLDIAVDDTDKFTRKNQLLWLGRPDDFVNPRRLGEIRLDGTVAPGTVRVTVF